MNPAPIDMESLAKAVFGEIEALLKGGHLNST